MGQYLKRKDLAGKTGTTNNAEDTWFVGYNPDFTTGVWVGFDEKRPLGRREEAARAALPVWAYFMRDILLNKPEKEFAIPPQITFRDMLTFPADQKENNIPRLVREPVYTPFEGLTLVMAPMDLPESMASSAGGIAQALSGNNSILGGPVFGFFPNTSSSSLNPVAPPPTQQNVNPLQDFLQQESKNAARPGGNLVKPTFGPTRGPVQNPETINRQKTNPAEPMTDLRPR